MIAADNAPIPTEVKELFDYLISYAAHGRLGVLLTTDKRTGTPRYTLFGEHPKPDGGATLVPLGFLSTTAGDEVDPPGLPRPVFINLQPERYDEWLLAMNVEMDRWADDGGPCASI